MRGDSAPPTPRLHEDSPSPNNAPKASYSQTEPKAHSGPRAESSALYFLCYHQALSAQCSLSICTRPARSGMRASRGGGRAWRLRHVWPQQPRTPSAQGRQVTPRASEIMPLSQDLKDKQMPQTEKQRPVGTHMPSERRLGGAGCLVGPGPRGPGVAHGREPSMHL